MSDQKWITKAKIWNDLYQSITQPLLPKDLPIALALIHPNYWIDWRGEEFELSEEGWGASELVQCEFHEIADCNCPWNEDKNLQGKLHHDHRWPKSLGGPKSGFNLLSLCESHNLAKGNGLWGFDWDMVPEWLQQRLTELRRMKLKGIDSDYL